MAHLPASLGRTPFERCSELPGWLEVEQASIEGRYADGRHEVSPWFARYQGMSRQAGIRTAQRSTSVLGLR
jgi:hypothetical protein